MAQDGSDVTVETLLGEPVLRGRLLGGKAGLRRQVSWCLPLSEIAPAPVGQAAVDEDLAGIAVYAAAAELAGVGDPKTLLTSLARRGAAVLFARSQGGADVDLGPVMRAADSARLPLVRLAPEADYHVIGRLVAVKAIAGTAHVLEYSVRVHRTLGEVFASGAGLPALAQAMSTLSGTTVLILDQDGEPLARAERDRGATDEQWRRLAAVLHDQQSGRPAQGRHHPTAQDAVVTAPWGGRVHVVSTPVSVAGDAYGSVAVIESALPPDPHDVAQHRVIVEQGAPLVASEILRQRSVTEAEERSRDDFLDTLVHGRFSDAHALQARSRHHRFDCGARHAVFVAAVPPLGPARAQQVQRAVMAARGVAGKGFTIAGYVGQLLVLVRELTIGDGAAGVPATASAEKNELRRLGRVLFRVLSERTGTAVQVAHGRAADGAAGVAASFREARIALELSRRVQVPEVCGYDELRVFAAIEEAAAGPQAQAFAAEVLGPLRRADGQTGNLEQVVLAYIAESGNLNAAARRLQLHRNTMLYKLERASRALQMDVRSAETQFTVWLAHRIQTLNDSLQVLRTELSPPA